MEGSRGTAMAGEKPRAPKRGSSNCLPILKKTRFMKKKANGRNPNLVPLGKNKLVEDVKERNKEEKVRAEENVETILLSTLPAAQQLSFFLDRFQSANSFKLSQLELEEYKDTCMIEISTKIKQDVEDFSKHIKKVFGESWKNVLCEGKIFEGTIEPGSPAVLIVSVSALKSLELIRGLKIFTRECRPAKLFAKHMKVEEQAESLKHRVNIASGTPSRIKKLIDMDVLMLSRLEVIILDMRSDAKGYSLLSLPQVSAEFWDLYKAHFNERIIEGTSRICFYGPTELRKSKKSKTEGC